VDESQAARGTQFLLRVFVRFASGTALACSLRNSLVISVATVHVHSEGQNVMVYQLLIVLERCSTFKQQRGALAVLLEATKIILAYFKRVVLSYMAVIEITCKRAANRQVS
jgi:hypothetical protein